MKYSRKSQPSQKKSPLRISSLPKAVILMVVLLASTGCTSMPTKEANDPYRDILISMAPEVPNLPPFPELGWSYGDDLYCLSEEDADKLLNYGENTLPLFRYELNLYTRQLHIILEALKNP